MGMGMGTGMSMGMGTGTSTSTGMGMGMGMGMAMGEPMIGAHVIMLPPGAPIRSVGASREVPPEGSPPPPMPLLCPGKRRAPSSPLSSASKVPSVRTNSQHLIRPSRSMSKTSKRARASSRSSEKPSELRTHHRSV